MRLMILLLTICGFAGPLSAQEDSRLQRLQTAEDSKDWDAVGRLDIGRSGFCTGALVAEDLVLTAAHCLYNRFTGTPEPLERIEFLAGWRDGRARAYRKVRRAVVHPEYVFDSDALMKRVSYDLALLELDRPISTSGIVPFRTGSHPRKGDKVGVVSYAFNRSEEPSLQEQCRVMARRPGILMLSCDIDFGSSGAPIFSFKGGEARIVSVVSAKSDVKDQKVALGTPVVRSLDLLKLNLAEGEDVWTPTKSVGFGSGGARASGGAKFVKP